MTYLNSNPSTLNNFKHYPYITILIYLLATQHLCLNFFTNFLSEILRVWSEDAEMVKLTESLTSFGQHSIAFLAREYLINFKSV